MGTWRGYLWFLRSWLDTRREAGAGLVVAPGRLHSQTPQYLVDVQRSCLSRGAVAFGSRGTVHSRSFLSRGAVAFHVAQSTRAAAFHVAQLPFTWCSCLSRGTVHSRSCLSRGANAFGSCAVGLTPGQR